MDTQNGAPRFVDDYLLSLLARASFVVSSEFHGRLRARGVSVPVWRVLAMLSGGPETVTALAEACLLQQPTMTKVLDRMERDGLVKRQRMRANRRLVRVHLAPKGRRWWATCSLRHVRTRPRWSPATPMPPQSRTCCAR